MTWIFVCSSLGSPSTSIDSMLPHSASDGMSEGFFLPEENEMLRSRIAKVRAAVWVERWNILDKYPSTTRACDFNLAWLTDCRRSLLFEIYLLRLFVCFDFTDLCQHKQQLEYQAGPSNIYQHFVNQWMKAKAFQSLFIQVSDFSSSGKQQIWSIKSK